MCFVWAKCLSSPSGVPNPLHGCDMHHSDPVHLCTQATPRERWCATTHLASPHHIQVLVGLNIFYLQNNLQIWLGVAKLQHKPSLWFGWPNTMTNENEKMVMIETMIVLYAYSSSESVSNLKIFSRINNLSVDLINACTTLKSWTLVSNVWFSSPSQVLIHWLFNVESTLDPRQFHHLTLQPCVSNIVRSEG